MLVTRVQNVWIAQLCYQQSRKNCEATAYGSGVSAVAALLAQNRCKSVLDKLRLPTYLSWLANTKNQISLSNRRKIGRRSIHLPVRNTDYPLSRTIHHVMRKLGDSKSAKTRLCTGLIVIRIITYECLVRKFPCNICHNIIARPFTRTNK
jgi:hypothetical protein